MFGHNTNIWAAKAPVAGGSKLQQLEGHVGMIPLDAPPDTFYSEVWQIYTGICLDLRLEGHVGIILQSQGCTT